MVTSAYLGDRFHVRGPILVFNSLVALIGLPVMGFASSSGARYFGVFLVTAGTNANIPVALAYQANNVRGQWKRALTSALFVGCGGIGGISGGTIFRLRMHRDISQGSVQRLRESFAPFSVESFI